MAADPLKVLFIEVVVHICDVCICFMVTVPKEGGGSTHPDDIQLETTYSRTPTSRHLS